MQHLPAVVTFTESFVTLAGNCKKISYEAVLLLGELGELHLEKWERHFCANVRRQVDPSHHRIAQVFVGRFPGAVQQFFPIDDFHNAIPVIAVGEIDTIALRASGYNSVQPRGRAQVAPGSWPGQPKSRINTGFVGSDKSYTSVMR